MPGANTGFARLREKGGDETAPEKVSFSGREESVAQRTTRVLNELQRKRANGYYEGAVVWDEIKMPDGKTQAVIHIGNPYESETRVIKTIPTELSKADVDKIRTKVIWTREMCRMTFAMGQAYEAHMGLIIQGESAIGKSFAVNTFSKLLSGEKPETFDCNGQTDSGDLMAKPVPDTGRGKTNPKLEAFLKSPHARQRWDKALQEAADVGEESRADFLQQQLQDLVRSSGVSGGQGMFKIQLGAIPKAMTWKKGANGADEYPEQGGTGKILHIQEVTLAKGSIINILLALRGEGRRLANELQLWQDEGQKITGGPKYWVVMSANPFDGAGFTAREPLDKALLRGNIVLRMGDLCQESWVQICKEVCGFSIGNLPKEKPINCAVEYYKIGALVSVIAETLSTFHMEYKQALAADPKEKEREEKVMASQDDIAQVAQLLLSSQLIDSAGNVDMAATFRQAVKETYLSRHLADEEDEDSGKGFGARMELALETLLTGKDTGTVKIGGRTMTRADAMNDLCNRAAKPPAERAKAAAADVAGVVANMDDDLKKLLGM